MLQMEKKLKLTAEFLANWQMRPIIWFKKVGFWLSQYIGGVIPSSKKKKKQKQIKKTNQLFFSAPLEIWTNRKYTAIWKECPKYILGIISKKNGQRYSMTRRLLRCHYLDFSSLHCGLVSFTQSAEVCAARMHLSQNQPLITCQGCHVPSVVAQGSMRLPRRHHLLGLWLSLLASQTMSLISPACEATHI